MIAGAFVLVFFTLQAQEAHNSGGCGYTGKSPWLAQYQYNRETATTQRDLDTTWLYVPVTVHIVGKDNGSGYYPTQFAIRAICEMNGQFEASHIRFYFKPGDAFRFINNSAWYEHDWDGGSDMINGNRLPNRLNIFVVGDPAGNCGYSWQDAIVLGKNCSGSGNTTWAHEAGHHLSLPHPFYGWEGFDWNYNEPAPSQTNGHAVERKNGSNCNAAGDGFCDTPPDYLNFRWSCNGDFESTTLQTDPNGVTFRSDASIIMGYALDACASRFSPEQIEAMRANLYDEHSEYLQINQPLADLPDDANVNLISPIDTQVTQYNDLTMSWNALPGATFYTLEIGLFSNFVPTIYSQTISTSVTSGMISTHVAKVMPNNRVMYWRVHAYNNWDVCQPIGEFVYGVFKTQNLSATNELEKVFAAELSPNPVASGLPAMLSISADQTMDALLYVSDMAGKKCIEQNIRVAAGDNQLEISTTGLQAGLYIVTLQNEKGLIVKRLSVSR